MFKYLSLSTYLHIYIYICRYLYCLLLIFCRALLSATSWCYCTPATQQQHGMPLRIGHAARGGQWACTSCDYDRPACKSWQCRLLSVLKQISGSPAPSRLSGTSPRSVSGRAALTSVCSSGRASPHESEAVDFQPCVFPQSRHAPASSQQPCQ